MGVEVLTNRIFKNIDIIYYRVFFVIAILISGCNNTDTPEVPNTNSLKNPIVKVLKHVDNKIGEGTVALQGQKIAVHYSGWLYNDLAENKKGKLFDTSADLGEPLIFILGNRTVIKGWDEGIPGMQVGGRRTLIIPSEMAYGSKRMGTARTAIPKDSALVFEIELIDVM